MGYVITATVGFVYINLEPEYELPTRRVSDNSGCLEKLKLEALSSPAIPKETISARGPSSCSWLPVRHILSASLTSEI